MQFYDMLTHCGLVTPYGNIRSWSTLVKVMALVNIGNDLLPDGTKPLPEPMLTSHQASARSTDIYLSVIS